MHCIGQSAKGLPTGEGGLRRRQSAPDKVEGVPMRHKLKSIAAIQVSAQRMNTDALGTRIKGRALTANHETKPVCLAGALVGIDGIGSTGSRDLKCCGSIRR